MEPGRVSVPLKGAFFFNPVSANPYGISATNAVCGGQNIYVNVFHIPNDSLKATILFLSFAPFY